MRDKDQIREVILKHMRANVSNLEEAIIDPTKSMIEYGANSLDLMEIVSSSLRELGIKVPRTELATLKNINDLVDLLWAKQGGGSAPQPDQRARIPDSGTAEAKVRDT